MYTDHSGIVWAELDSEDVHISKGFKQGCVTAPDLFSIYLDTVVQQLQPLLQRTGVIIQFRINGDLKQVHKPTDEQLMWIFMYTDDIALLAEDTASLKAAIELLDAVFSDWGLTVSTSKTKILVIERDSDTQAATLDIKLRGDNLEVVSKFKYLGSIFTSDGCLDAEIGHRLVSAGVAWHQLKARKLWCSKSLALARKLLFFRTIVLSILLYDCETWPALERHTQRLEVFQMNCLRYHSYNQLSPGLSVLSKLVPLQPNLESR